MAVVQVGIAAVVAFAWGLWAGYRLARRELIAFAVDAVRECAHEQPGRTIKIEHLSSSIQRVTNPFGYRRKIPPA